GNRQAFSPRTARRRRRFPAGWNTADTRQRPRRRQERESAPPSLLFCNGPKKLRAPARYRSRSTWALLYTEWKRPRRERRARLALMPRDSLPRKRQAVSPITAARAILV